jgi:DNA segregation ATPase FtsK/SpoIIIE, S-DNA-T family
MHLRRESDESRAMTIEHIPDGSQTAEIAAADALVGAILYQHVQMKLGPLINAADFRGALHVLSGFAPAQLFGFVRSFENANPKQQRILIQFSKSLLSYFKISSEHIATVPTVAVRNRSTDGKLVIIAEMEEDEAASLADVHRTDAEELKDPSISLIWVDYVADQINLPLLPEPRRQLIAMLKGLFETGGCPTGKAAEYLHRVLCLFRAGQTLVRAAGQALPVLGLPKYEDCFSSLTGMRMGQASQWRDKFTTHSKRECYLTKQQPSGELLNTETLRSTYKRLKEDLDTPLPDAVLEAFDRYINVDSGTNSPEKELLFENDWEYVQQCFEKQKKRSSRDFAERTRFALLRESETDELSRETLLIIELLKKTSRKSGSATPEFREFFENHSKALECDPTLFLEWEDFIHGKKITCSDLFVGITECLQRTIRARTPGKAAYIVLRGQKQNTPSSFAERNQRACEYFERSYRSLPAVSERRIQFQDTKALSYRDKVLPLLKDKPKFNPSKKTGPSLVLEFRVLVYEKEGRGLEDKQIANLSLTWRFPIESVLGNESKDFDALSRYYEKCRTSLVAAVAQYDALGKKGIPSAVSLEDVNGLADNIGAAGKGSFIPAQHKIHSLAGEWEAEIKKARSIGAISSTVEQNLCEKFSVFEMLYNKTVLALKQDPLLIADVRELSSSYRELLLAVGATPHETTLRKLLRVVLSIGVAGVGRNGKRPSLAVVCPWHPVRIEAAVARQGQFLQTISRLLGSGHNVFSDGVTGNLFFREVQRLLSQPLYPEAALVWEGSQSCPRIAAQAIGGYSLHFPDDRNDGADSATAKAVETLERIIDEYLRLQPHERDNLSLLLYDCASPDLPSAVVKAVTAMNERRSSGKITCEVLLTHTDSQHLRKVYKDLVANGAEQENDVSADANEFLSRVRVNITAAKSLARHSRSLPVDIAYCRDVVSRKAKTEWKWVSCHTVSPDELQPHQWSRRVPIADGDRVVRLRLVCPAQTELGWAYLSAIAGLCGQDSKTAWQSNRCPILTKALDFDDQHVDRIFRETHDLATWVVNQDELLDRKLLESQSVKVIRYIQSATQGRNLIISSTARETFLRNTLKEKLQTLLPSEVGAASIDTLCSRFLAEANRISGGLVLKAARRANNTNELMGMVLSRYIVQSELGPERQVAWCFLDDYAQWLGKKDDASISDLLVLAPTHRSDGALHLDVVVTEAKFITYDAYPILSKKSEKQLSDTLTQIHEALVGEIPTVDKDIWLARLSDLLLTQLVTSPDTEHLDLEAWRDAIRSRACTVSVRGYSHVCVYGPMDLEVNISHTRGITHTSMTAGAKGYQEVFGPHAVRCLITQFSKNQQFETMRLRERQGLPIEVTNPDYNYTSLAKSGNLDLRSEERTVASDSETQIPDVTEIPRDTEDEDDDDDNGTTNEDRTSFSDGEQKIVPSGDDAASLGDPLLSFLQQRSETSNAANEDGNAWLNAVTMQLRQALLSRALPAKLAEHCSPILTPNAAIIKLQGSTALTVQAVENRAQEIFTSDGLKIIGTVPEAGRISIAIERPNRQILHTIPLLLQRLQQDQGSLGSEEIMVAIKEDDGLPLFLDPFQQPHTLVAGKTGSGKSVLMQNLILYIAATRSLEEARILLIDSKQGVDYRPLDTLPHVQAGSGGVIETQKAALDALGWAVQEMERRYQLFKENLVANIRAYRRKTETPMPTLWIIHDEFADWMQTEEYNDAVPELVGRLGVKARAAGIFLVFAAQRPDKDVMPMQLRSQLGNRLILQVDSAGTSEIALGEKNLGAERLLGRGHLLAKTGDAARPIYAQVPYTDPETEIPPIVDLISKRYPKGVASLWTADSG